MKYFLLLLTIAFLYSCSENDSENQNTKIFSELSPEQTSITFSNKLIESDSLNYFNYGYIYMGGGISAGDINNDGLVDLFFTGNMVPNKLYLNKGNLKFEDISEAANITGDNRWFTGVTMADVNADGYLDIYCSVSGKYGPRENLLYINNGDTTFTERAEQYGIADNGHSIQSTFFDYDLDGDLDLYVANYPPTKFSTPNSFYQYKMQHTKAIESDQLYRNDGSTFTNVTDEANVKSFGLTNSAMVSDINNDGWPDIYVSNDFNVPDYLYINNQNGTFTENVQRSTSQTALFGMGVDIADFNNDGLLDILQMDMTPGDNRRSKANMASMNTSLFWGTVNAGFGFQYMQNMLQLNNGMIDKTSQPKFSNISRLAGVSTTDWSWGPLFADLDNDGWKDIFITNGTRREINNKDYFDKIDKKENHDMSFLEKSLGIPSEKIDNFVFRNKGDLTFEKVNDKWGLSFSGFSNGSVYVDLDNDGDLEIVINNVDDYATVFENSSSDQNNFLALKFKGPNGNVSGLGVKVTLYTNDMVQYQELTLSRGFQSSVAPRLHFGLGKIKVIDTLKIIWPDGKSQLMWDVEINQTIVIDHSQSINNLIPMASSSSTQLFGTERDTNIIISHEHVENLYDDFEKEILLPHQTSMLGPNVSGGDLNNDGLDD
ncbi:MAG: CRTAC1 family protein, partial [Saprospiraceae bacterium]